MAAAVAPHPDRFVGSGTLPMQNVGFHTPLGRHDHARIVGRDAAKPPRRVVAPQRGPSTEDRP